MLKKLHSLERFVRMTIHLTTKTAKIIKGDIT